ncbi:hypothetical protein ABPG72_009283 [Tetrahymena utriculariae]
MRQPIDNTSSTNKEVILNTQKINKEIIEKNCFFQIESSSNQEQNQQLKIESNILDVKISKEDDVSKLEQLNNTQIDQSKLNNIPQLTSSAYQNNQSKNLIDRNMLSDQDYFKSQIQKQYKKKQQNNKAFLRQCQGKNSKKTIKVQMINSFNQNENNEKVFILNEKNNTQKQSDILTNQFGTDYQQQSQPFQDIKTQNFQSLNQISGDLKYQISKDCQKESYSLKSYVNQKILTENLENTVKKGLKCKINKTFKNQTLQTINLTIINTSTSQIAVSLDQQTQVYEDTNYDQNYEMLNFLLQIQHQFQVQQENDLKQSSVNEEINQIFQINNKQESQYFQQESHLIYQELQNQNYELDKIIENRQYEDIYQGYQILTNYEPFNQSHIHQGQEVQQIWPWKEIEQEKQLLEYLNIEYHQIFISDKTCILAYRKETK